MTEGLADVLDGAQYTETRVVTPDSFAVAVWHGGHTVNFYTVAGVTPQLTADPTSTISVGDFETDEVTRGEVEAAISEHFDREWEAFQHENDVPA